MSISLHQSVSCSDCFIFYSALRHFQDYLSSNKKYMECLFEPHVRFHILVPFVEWPPIGKQLLTRLTICFLGISI